MVKYNYKFQLHANSKSDTNKMGFNKNTFLTILLDLTILGLMLTGLLVIKYVPTPNQRGFFCQDISIRLPYFSSTIPTSVNVTTSYGVNILIILITRLLITRGGVWSTRLSQMWSDARCFIAGCLATQVISGVCKVMAGRLRPHFLAVCNPSIIFDEGDGLRESEDFPGHCGWNQFDPKYVTNFTCLGNTELFPELDKREHRIHESRLSFLSGHASLASYGMVFAVLYLTFHYRKKMSPLPLMLLQLLLLVYMIATSISRVSDNKHHPTDVLAGMFLGSIMAILAFLTGNMEKEEDKNDVDEIMDTSDNQADVNNM